MVAAKVQSPVATKNAAANRTVQLKTSVQKDDFTKLLQQKKDVADQPKKPDSKPSDSNKVDNSEKDEKAPDSLEVKKEGADQEQGELSVSDNEAMRQMAMEQAAAQMMIQPEITEEPVVEQQAVVSAEPQITAVEEVHEEAVVLEPEAKTAGEEQPKIVETAKKPDEKTETAEKPEVEIQEKVAPQVQKQSDAGKMTDQKQFEGQPKAEVTEDKRVSQVSNTEKEGQETGYISALQANTREEGVTPVIQRTEEVPLKTTVQNLPEDLGKTLAAKTFEQGKTLTVELEPVSLGKLTIKLVYEGERAALSIMASNPKTLELLNQKASEIAAILEEKTGQETVIYTHQAEQGREEFEENQNSHSGQDGQEDRQQERHQEKHQTESFAQQLRLGLV